MEDVVLEQTSWSLWAVVLSSQRDIVQLNRSNEEVVEHSHHARPVSIFLLFHHSETFSAIYDYDRHNLTTFRIQDRT